MDGLMDIATHFWSAAQNPILYALPVFFTVIALEAAFYWWDTRSEQRAAVEKGYLPIDTRTSLMMGGGALVAMVVFKMLTLVLFVWIWQNFRLFDIPTNAWSWAGILLVTDFTWYCNHRFSHRIRIGWAAHQAHHSSEYFNFGTALRQKWNPWSEAIWWLPLPFLGFEPVMIYAVFGGNLVFQFFSHTERIGKLWAPIEYVFNTPSHHRVHHGSDDIYLDRNYGGILIVWDRMFGTFQPEVFTPRYGLTTPVETYNLLELEYGEYRNIWRDVRSTKGLRNKLGYVFGPPGWNPVDGSPVLPAHDDPVRRVRATATA